MSLPGVESARRRRASHEKKAAAPHLSTFSFRQNQRFNSHHYSPTQLMRGADMVAGIPGPNVEDDVESELLDRHHHHRRAAMAARVRLHEKLRRLSGHHMHSAAHHCHRHRDRQEASVTIPANARSSFHQSITSLLHKTKSMVPFAMTEQQTPEPDNGHNENGSTCPVCLDTLTLKTLDNSHSHHHHNTNVAKHPLVISLPCGHAFHLDCLHLWLSSAASSKSCPLCRAPISSPPFSNWK